MPTLAVNPQDVSPASASSHSPGLGVGRGVHSRALVIARSGRVHAIRHRPEGQSRGTVVSADATVTTTSTIDVQLALPCRHLSRSMWARNSSTLVDPRPCPRTTHSHRTDCVYRTRGAHSETGSEDERVEADCLHPSDPVHRHLRMRHDYLPRLRSKLLPLLVVYKQNFFKSKIEIAEHTINKKTQNLRRLEAQRNNLNARVRLLREELQLLQEPGSYVGEVVKVMSKNKVLVKTQPEGKYIVDFSNDIKLEDLRPNLRVALRSDCEWVREDGRAGTD